MLHKRVRQLLEELEVPIDVDEGKPTFSLAVNESQNLDFSALDNGGYMLRLEIGKHADQDMEELYMDAMLTNFFTEEADGMTLSVSGEDKGYVTLSREMDLGYQQFADDFERFMNKVDYWTARWKNQP